MVTEAPLLPVPAVKVTEQVPALVVQVVELKAPSPVGETEKVTVPPVGEIWVPLEVSDTVAVQVVVPVTGMLVGVQEIAIDDVLLAAVTAAAPELVACSESPPYAPVTVIAPSFPANGVKVVVQDAVAPLPDRVQLVDEKDPFPLGVVVKLTVPVGVTGDRLVSVTVTVQVVPVFTGGEAGEQVTEVAVLRRTVTEVVPVEATW
jgi:hypothetical protein